MDATRACARFCESIKLQQQRVEFFLVQQLHILPAPVLKCSMQLAPRWMSWQETCFVAFLHVKRFFSGLPKQQRNDPSHIFVQKESLSTNNPRDDRFSG